MAHFPAVLEIQLHATGQHGETQAEQQNEQQQTAHQAIVAGALHRVFTGRLIMSR
ncbi:AAA family ATPase [Pseudomonas taetrolens]|uniref:AAA family ATPase n=1 Tax=Pseudomonas taetrolens TaxID=47884 RepID=UPI0037C8F5F0